MQQSQPAGDPHRPPPPGGAPPPFYSPQGPQTPPLPHQPPPYGAPGPQFKPPPGPFPPHGGPPSFGGPQGMPPMGIPPPQGGGGPYPPPQGQFRPPGPPLGPGQMTPPGPQGPQGPPGPHGPPPGPFPPPGPQGPQGTFPPGTQGPPLQGIPRPAGPPLTQGGPFPPPQGLPPQGGQFSPGPPPTGGQFPPQTSPQFGRPPGPGPQGTPPPHHHGGHPPPSSQSGHGNLPPPQFGGSGGYPPPTTPPSARGPPPPSSAHQQSPPSTFLQSSTPPPTGYPPAQYGTGGAPYQPPANQFRPPPPTFGGAPQHAQAAPPTTTLPAPPPSTPQPPASRIDPNQIPSPTTVADGKTVKYLTSSLSCPPPPPASGQYVAVDEGNATPRFVRMSIYSLPCTDELQSTSHLPISMIVQPLAETLPGEEPVPLVDLSIAGGPVRCRRCHAYMNPFNKFVDGGRKYLCKLCSCENDVPEAYFSPLEGSGKRHDVDSRPELSRGSVDIVATGPQYITRPPSKPSFLFVIDVSEFAVASGLLQAIINTLRVVLLELAEQNAESDGAVDPKIGIITYDATIHFWNIRPSLAQPQMLVVSDLTNVFVPLSSEAFLVPYSQARTVVDALLDKLPVLFKGGRAPYSTLAPVVQASSMALEQVGGGRAIVFWSGVEAGTAATKRREDLKMVGTEKEKTLLTQRNPALKTLASECITRQSSVDLFVCTSSQAQPIDVASLSALPSLTGASLFYYPAFEAERDSDRLAGELRRTVTRPCGYDAIAKVRTSAGLTVSEYLGNFRLSNSHDIEFATIDSEKSILINLKHDDKLDEKTDSVIQFAMLYTSSKGDRRIRVHTICLNNTNTIGNLYKHADLDTILNVYARQAVRDMQSNTMSAVRTALVDKCVDVLAAYRKHCASTTSPGQLILPESLKLLPIYVLALTKHPLFRGYVDVQAFHMNAFNDMSPAFTTPVIYPRLYPLHKPITKEASQDETGRTILPTPQRLFAEYLEADGAYLMENGQEMYLWLGRNASPSMSDLFAEVVAAVNLRPGAPAAQRTHPDADRVIAYVHAIRRQRCKGAVVRVVRTRDANETKLLSWLVEDRAGEAASYVDFLVQVHKMIQGRLA